MSSSSGEQLDPDSARKKAVNGVKKAFKPEPSQQTNSVLASLRQRAVQMLLVVGVMVALSWALGSLITVRTGAILFAGLVILSLATDRLGEFSFTFTLSAVALGGLIIAFALPAFVTDAFSSIIPTINALTGLQVQRIDPVRFALLSGALILVAMFVDIRIASAYRRESGRPIAANADTVARAMSRRVRKLFEEYVAIGVAIGFLGFAIVLELTKGAGDLGAQVFDVLAEAPIISAALGSDLLAYKALGGPLPVVDDLPLIGAVLGWLAGNIDYVGFAALAGFILLIAVLSKRNK